MNNIDQLTTVQCSDFIVEIHNDVLKRIAPCCTHTNHHEVFQKAGHKISRPLPPSLEAYWLNLGVHG